ncbi:hypothetical protein NC652_015128 [Populus alba x Populus x berolinensis]|nr:hypothetical protein NC652_015128 [Populus alba x Populus x berolinensis]
MMENVPSFMIPPKFAVCTKFLNGLCFNPECKLTHEVIPERMPDCSYFLARCSSLPPSIMLLYRSIGDNCRNVRNFLAGLCTNEVCPYRHVRVNPNASICEGFLRGYCADANEVLAYSLYSSNFLLLFDF